MDVNESLLEAVRCGRVERARELIDTYSDFWRNGYELLKLALQNRHADVAELLLSRVSEVNSEISDLVLCNTPLHIAARNGDTKIVEMIINKMVEFYAKNGYVCTPLHVAIANMATEAVELLLKHGADVNAKDCSHFTPLHQAVREGHQEIIVTLLSNAANVNTKDEMGRTPLHLAVREGHQEIIVTLLSNAANVNTKDEMGWTPLYQAVREGHQEIILTLLSNAANVNTKDERGWTPLHLAVREGQQEIIKILLLHGADVDVKSIDENTPLHLAVQKGHQDYLLECQEEIANMNIEKINETNISFYDILTNPIISLAIYMRNENVVAVLESDNYVAKFPKYFDMIKCNFRKGLERKELLEQANQIFHFFINNSDCTDKILSYLSNQDIRVLIDALKPLSISSLR